MPPAPSVGDELHDMGGRRERPWAEKKRRARGLARIYREFNPAKAAMVGDCANELWFQRQEDGRLRLVRAHFCKSRLCPVCAWRRSRRTAEAVRGVVSYMAGRQRGRKFAFLTLTVRNVRGRSLSSTVSKMLGAWGRLSRRAAFRGAFDGWFRALEVTHNTERGSKSFDSWHPHLHVVLAVKPGGAYLQQREVCRMWQEALGVDYTPVCDIRMLYGDVAAAAAEAAKYSVKDADYIIKGDMALSVRSVRVLDEALARRQLVAFGGKMLEAKKLLGVEEDSTGGEEAIDEGKPVLRYCFSAGDGKYRLVDVLPPSVLLLVRGSPPGG